MSVMLKSWISFLLLALAVYGGYSLWSAKQLHQAEVESRSESASTVSSIPGLDYSPTLGWADVSKVSLTERNGQPYPLSQLQGKVWVLSFFFASCPGSCRQINSSLAEIQRTFTEAGQDVTLVSVTVDPEIDTPEVLAEYARSFGADPQRWVFLTGQYETIRDLATDIFRMPMKRRTHHDRVVLVNQRGEIVKTYNTANQLDVAALHKKVAQLLDPAPASEAQGATESAAVSSNPLVEESQP